MTKLSVRFYNNHEVRAVWDEKNTKWWFSANDIVSAVNNEFDYKKAANYWRWLKKRYDEKNIQLVSISHDFKFESPDGKKRAADALDYDAVQTLAKYYPGGRAADFIDWFTYSDNSIDGQSRKKAYAFFDSNIIDDRDIGKTKSLQQIHAYIFGGLYDFAGRIRDKTISKGGFTFAVAMYLPETLKRIDNMPEEDYDEIIDKYIEMNLAHPFMEGNGRSTRIWLDLILKKRLGRCVDWSKVGKTEYLDAMIISHKDGSKIKALLKEALTDRINDREMFMKGIDYSYHYEEE
ncbi:MAG: Fic family protein [Methanomicrobium sp.]|nr:Fic family protein [Methanomicrobium sp.]